MEQKYETQLLVQMERMDKCVASVKRNFGTIRAGRASPDMLDRVMVSEACPLLQALPAV